MEAKYNISNRELLGYIRTLKSMNGDKEWVPVRDIDMHTSKQAFIVQALSENKIVATKSPTRAFTRRETDFTYTPRNNYFSHVMLTPNFIEKAREAGL